LIPFLILAGALVRGGRWRRAFLTYGLPLGALCELAMTWQFHNIREDRLRVTTHNIADVLALTQPDDYVMDDKGDYVFRRRSYYWVLEPITKARVRQGSIHDNIPQRMAETGTKLCSMGIARPGSPAAKFIVANYIPFDSETRDMGVLGQIIGSATDNGVYTFDVAIPQAYAVVAETGQAAGQLDGKPYTGPLWLSTGRHQFIRTAGSGRMAIILGDAYAKGFRPLYDTAENLTKDLATLPKGKREMELQ
jgi:hypothetical protein